MNTPTPSVMAAAEEIAEIAAQDPCNSLEGDDCAGDCKACLTERFAAIITRHCADAEKTLRVAAKWVHGCGICMIPFPTSCQPVEENKERCVCCWLEYWKKEAEE